MSEQDARTPRRAQMRALVVREAATLRRWRRVRRAGAVCMVVLVPSVIALTWSTVGRGRSPGGLSPPHQTPPVVNQPSPPHFRELAVEPGSPSGVVIITGNTQVRSLVTAHPAPVRYLNDHELLRLLEEAGQPSGVVHAGGVTRVVALSQPGTDAPR